MTMRWSRTVTMVEAHAEGEVGRVVTGGVPAIPGETMLDKMTYLNEVDDSLRRFLVFEPRASAQMSSNLLLPPCRDDADAGFIVLQADKAHAMSVSNSICVVTVLLETGILPLQEPETVLHLDTPAGLVRARARCRDGKCEAVSLDLPPAFLSHPNLEVVLPDLGPVAVDVAFGGIFYGLIPVAQLGLTIEPANARRLAAIGSAVHRAIQAEHEIVHPTEPKLKDLSYVMFTEETADGRLRGGTILPPGRFDRSPCGTGNAARLAQRHACGEVRVGDRYPAYSIIDSRFDVELLGETDVAGRTAVLPRVTGRGWIHGIHQVGVDPSDPYPQGYLLSDTWGEAFDLLN